MGQLEKESERRTKKNELKKLILQSVKVAGLLSLLVVAPNVIGAMAKLGIIRSPRQKDVIERSSHRLVRTGLLAWEKKRLRLTPRGEAYLRQLEVQNYQVHKPRWDGKWRVLIFDIPNYRKGLRDKIRHALLHIGFVRLQDSVWVYPYDCEDFITLLKADFHVGRDLLYMIVDTIESDKRLKEEFSLGTR